MNNPEINEKLFWETVDHIEKFPETYSQGIPGMDTPTCGSPCCFFGHAVYLHDGTLDKAYSVFDGGMWYLGLTYEEARNLYYSGFGLNEIGDFVTPKTLRRAVEIFLEKIKIDREKQYGVTTAEFYNEYIETQRKIEES